MFHVHSKGFCNSAFSIFDAPFTCSTCPLKPLNGIQRNLTGSKISTSSTKFVIFGPIGKTRRPPWSLIGWDIFDFFSETAERNSMELDRKQDLNVLYQVCVFRADRQNKMTALASDLLRHFRLLWNCWTEFNETWQEARSQCPLPSLYFVNKNGRPGRFPKEVAHCTQVHDMWPFGPLFLFRFLVLLVNSEIQCIWFWIIHWISVKRLFTIALESYKVFNLLPITGLHNENLAPTVHSVYNYHTLLMITSLYFKYT